MSNGIDNDEKWQAGMLSACGKDKGKVEMMEAEKNQKNQGKDKNQLEETRDKIRDVDTRLIDALADRMKLIQDIIAYKKKTGIPILQPEQEAKQTRELKEQLRDNPFEEEILDVFKYIMKNSRRVQAKALFDYNVFLIGFMGAGKSTIARELERKLEMQRIEMDELIEKKQGMTISEIFSEYGETYFRNLESNCLIELQKIKQAIVSCGGGIVLRPDNADHMKKNGRIVLLTAEPMTILDRVKDSTSRPILNNHMNVDYIKDLMDQRREKYLAVADVVVATDHKSTDEICDEIIAKLIAFDREQEEK